MYGISNFQFITNIYLSQGIISEFQVPKGKEEEDSVAYEFEWLYPNGLLAIIISLGFIYTAFKSRKARSWWYGTG